MVKLWARASKAPVPYRPCASQVLMIGARSNAMVLNAMTLPHPREIFGNMWRHFYYDDFMTVGAGKRRVRDGVRSWTLMGRGQGCC